MNSVDNQHYASWRWRVGASLLALSFIVPFLIPLHRLPIPSFYSEFASLLLVCLGSLWIFLCVPGENGRSVPKTICVPISLIGLVLLQWAFGLFVYVSTSLLILAYAIALTFLVLACAQLSSATTVIPLTRWFATALVIGSSSSALVGYAQLLGLQQMFPNFIAEPMPLQDSGIYGNVAQQNHFAVFSVLGFISLVYLWGHHQFNRFAGFLIAGLLLSSVLLSASRGAWLYLILAVAYSFSSRWKQLLSEVRGASRFSFTIILTSVFSILLLCFAFQDQLIKLPQVERLVHFFSSSSTRFFLWEKAWKIFVDSPLLGVGFDGFAYALTEQVGRGDVPNYVGVDHFAHNFFFQILACGGLLGLFVMLVLLRLTIVALKSHESGPQHYFGRSILIVLFSYGLFEQPMVYSYFSVIAIIFLILSTRAYVWHLNRWGLIRILLISMTVLATIVLLRSGSSYLQFERMMNRPTSSFNSYDHEKDLLNLAENLWLRPMVKNFAPEAFVPHQRSSQEKLALNRDLVRFAPLPESMFRQAALLAESGLLDEAKSQLRKAILNYPTYAEEYVQRIQFLAQEDPDRYQDLGNFGEQEIALLLVGAKK